MKKTSPASRNRFIGRLASYSSNLFSDFHECLMCLEQGGDQGRFEIQSTSSSWPQLRAERKSSSAPLVCKPDGSFRIPLLDSSSSEEDEVIDDDDFCYFEDDARDKSYRKVLLKDPKLWWCEVCGQTFEYPRQFVSHRRRHIAPELFRCPSCFMGFVHLRCCFDHEMKKHGKRNLETNSFQTDSSQPLVNSSNSAPCSASVSSMKVIDIDEGDNQGCSTGCRTVASTSLELYHGPPVKHLMESFDIEHKFGNHLRPVNEHFVKVRRNV